MLKLIPQYKQGNKSPDHDPDNPYHYHDAAGNKIVITPEEWEANIGKPYFREIEDAVRAEQAAYPEPEYEIDPNFVRDLRSTYSYNMGNGYLNYRNFSSSLPQGYNFTDEGLIVDPQGNYYVQSGYRQSSRFTYSTDNPLQFTIYKGKPIERNLTFYPVNMNRRVKAPLTVDRIMNVGEEREKAIENYIQYHKNKEPLYYTPWFRDPADPAIHIYGNRNALSDRYYDGRGDYNNWHMFDISPTNLDEADQYSHSHYLTREELDDALKTALRINNLYSQPNFWKSNKYKYNIPTRQEAEEKAIIFINPSERVNTFAAGGKLKLIPRALSGIQFPVILQPAVADNTRYVRPYISIEIAESKKAYEQEQLQRLIEAAQKRQPQLRADTRSTTQRQIDHNRTVQLEARQKANELAANFGRALGANHDMTVDEVNASTLNTLNLMGYMTSPYLMTTLESGYYGATGRPGEAAITAGVGFGLPIVAKPVVQITKKLPNTARSTVIANELKRDIKNTKLNEIISLPGQIGWAPKQIFTGYHASNERTFNPNFWYENWARTTHNAPYGVYIAEGTAPTEGFLAKRPYVHNVSAELEKPMIQIGELRTNTKNSARNKVERFAQKQGADAIIFQDIKDNQMNHQNILKTLNPDTKLIINNRASTLSDISYKDPSTSSPEHTLAKAWDNYLTNPEQSSYLSDLTGLSSGDVVSIDFPQSTYDYFENSVFPRS